MLTLPGPEKATLQAVGARSVELSSPAAGSVLVIEGACPPSGGHATQPGMSYRTGSTTTSGACPAFLVHNWPPAFKEWSTKVVRNAVFVSSLFPRLLRPYVLKDTTVRGVSQGVLAYAGIGPDGHYQPFYYVNAPGRTDLTSREVDLPSDDMFIIPAETARAYIKELERPEPVGTGDDPPPEPVVDPKPITGPRPPITPDPDSGESKDDDGSTPPNITPGKVRLAWTGNLPYQKWSLFYMKLLTKLPKRARLNWMSPCARPRMGNGRSTSSKSCAQPCASWGWTTRSRCARSSDSVLAEGMMITVVGPPDSREYEAALKLRMLVGQAWPGVKDSTEDRVYIVASAKCHGQIVRDVDLLLLASLQPGYSYAPFLSVSDRNGEPIRPARIEVLSLCAIIELKDHPPDKVEFHGTQVDVF